MWNLKKLPSNVILKVNFMIRENVRMASKQASADEKPKAPKRGFFRRSVSSASDKYGKGVAPNSLDTNTVSNESDDRRVVRRSSMICSEGFDKYTFDCHRHDIPTKAAGLDLDAPAASKQVIQNQSIPVSENSAFSYGQSSKPTSVEQNAVRKISPFKNLSALSITSPNKNVPMSSKRVTEEVIPVNMPLSYKRVPEETIPVTNTFAGSKGVPESPVTNIPFSFSPDPRERDRISQLSALKNSPVKSPAVTNIPFSFTPGPRENDRITKMSALKNNPIKTAAVTDIPFSFTPDHRENDRIANLSSLRNNPIKSAPVKNSPFSFKNMSNDTMPVRNTPLSFKVTPEKSRPVTKAFSFRSVSDEPSSIRNASLSYKHDLDEYTPSRSAPLSFKNVPQQTVSNNYVSDEPMPVRNMPLSLKGASVSLRNIPTSVKHEESFTPTRSIPSSLQPVPEESALVKDSEFQKHMNDEPIPFRNSPLALKPILTKHISLLKKKTPSVKGPIMKRDSVVHPGKIDMQSSLFIDGRFQNPWPTWKPPTFANLLKFGVTRNKSKVPPKQELDLILPIVKQNFSKLSVPEDGVRVTWIGHSTVLVQMHGLNILTDPIFSERASPSQVVGPKRYRDPPCTIHDLPHINAVVISHSHYDHLDHNTITLLNARFGAELRWFVPLGLQVWMQEVGCENVVELDWWEENHVPEHTDTFFVFTPAQHWSKRAIGDDNKVLWGSWCVLGPKYRFFFAGDTGYCDAFKQIGKVHGPFDLSAIPIGAYEPRWFMKYQHVNPEEAVKIHMDVRSKKSLAIHWGTFSLANEYYLDPPVKLRESLDKYEIPPELFFTLKHGESRLIAQNNLVKKYPLSERNANVS